MSTRLRLARLPRPAPWRRSTAVTAAVLPLLLLAGVTTAARPAAGQGTARRPGDARTSSADSLVELALTRARAGDTTLALWTLERATKIAPDYAPAFYQRGLLLSRTTSLGLSDSWRRHQAAKEIDHALDLDPNNPFYLLELGRIRLKTPLLRLEAERMFHKALAAAESRHDPRALADIRFEIAEIYGRRYESMANRRLLSGTQEAFDPTAALADPHYTKQVLLELSQPLPDAGELDYRQAEDYYRAALLADPAHEPAALGLLNLLSEARRYEEMERTARAFLAAQPGSARGHLALGLALHRLDRDAPAQAAFDTALALLPADEVRDMTALSSILDEERAATYDRSGDAARSQVDSAYWDAVDPLRLTPGNEAHTEFLARVAYADLRFSSAEFGHQGWRTDRGQIYIRYGEPTKVATFAPDPDNAGGGESFGRVTTVWWYDPSNLYFVFAGPPAMNVATFAGDFRRYAANARYHAPVLFDDVAKRLRLDTVAVQIARFRPETPGTAGAEVVVYADVPTGRMLRDVDINQAPLETGIFISDTSRHLVLAARDSAVVRPRGGDRVATRTWARTLAPGEYVYRVEAHESVSGSSARGLGPLPVTSFPSDSLSMSDLLVARHIAPRSAGLTPRNRRDYFIAPNPAFRFAGGDTLFLYWEEYGLARDAAGNGKVRVQLTLRLNEVTRAGDLLTRVIGGVADAVGLSAKGDDRVALRFDRTVALTSENRTPNYLAIDLGHAPPGTYTVELMVTDLVAGRSARRQRPIRLVSQ